MKEIIYQPALRRDKTLYGLAQRATPLLDEILGGSGADVTAEWDRAEDAAFRGLAILRLSDFSGAANAVFTPEELESLSDLPRRFRFLWGDLLQVRARTILENLMEAGAGQGGG